MEPTRIMIMNFEGEKKTNVRDLPIHFLRRLNHPSRVVDLEQHSDLNIRVFEGGVMDVEVLVWVRDVGNEEAGGGVLEIRQALSE